MRNFNYSKLKEVRWDSEVLGFGPRSTNTGGGSVIFKPKARNAGKTCGDR